MALRRSEKNVRKLNRTGFRRPAGRTAEFFDLRETDENNSTNRKTEFRSERSAGAGRYTGRGSGVSADSTYGGTGGPSFSVYSKPGCGAADRYGSASYRRSVNTSGSADDSAGLYRERHRVEVNADSQKKHISRAEDLRGADSDRGSAFYGGGQKRESGRIVRGNASGSRYSSHGRSAARDSAGTVRGGRYGSAGRGDDLLYHDPYDGLYEDSFDDFRGDSDRSGEGAADRRGVSARRLRQRAAVRRQRERELRSLYLKIGIGTAVLLLAIFLFPRVFSAVHLAQEGDEKGKQEQTAAREQENAGSADEEDVTDATAVEENSGQEEPASQQADESTEAEGAGAADAVPEQKEEDTGQADAVQEQNEEDTGQADAVQEQNEEDTGQADAVQAEDVSGTTDTDSENTVTSGTALITAAASGEYSRQDDWRFILVNPWYIMPEEYAEVDTLSIPNGESVDRRCYREFVQMLDDCRAGGGEPVVCSSYRPHTKQVALYEEQVSGLMSSGMTREEAEAEAGTVVAIPGTSEHELGLAVDICDYYNQNLDDSQAKTATQKWLLEHSWEYGFILRYPEDKSEITGIIYEPWHYRYVGKEAAKEIAAKGICLEEYLKK